MTTASASDDHDDARQVAAWAARGTMALTGRPDRPPLGPPRGLVPKLGRIAAVLADRSAALGQRVDIDPLGLLGERAAIGGLRRQGTTSCGGATKLLATSDAWIAVSLARPEDVELVPAWLEVEVGSHDDVWAVVTTTAARCPAAQLLERGTLLGLPVARLGEAGAGAASPPPLDPLPLCAIALGDVGAHRSLAGVRVVDLSSLWAGPLCGSVLVAAGAEVVKVEATGRPDGARSGPPEFFDLLNAGKRSVALDLRSDHGRRALAALVASADVVIEASRPRALEQLGIHAETMVRQRTSVWASITGYGRTGPGRDRVAFGDDAAVAGGLVAGDDGPCFCSDAIADPATGLVAAAAIVDALAVGRRWLLDISMASVAAHLAGPTLEVPGDVQVAEPSIRTAVGTGPALGEHTAEVLAEWTAH